jgi:hypothetical protein
MNENKNITAHFTINQYTLTINTQGNGTVNKNPDYPTYPYGTIVTLTAIPDTGWTFDHWSGDLTGNQNPTNITMNENKIINAYFFVKDLIPPTVQITKPTKAIYLMDKKIIPFFYPIVLNEITIEVNAYDNDSGIEKVEFYIDGELRETDVSPPYSYLWNDKLTSQHTIEVKAYDNAGNSASEEISVLKGIVKHPWLVLAIVMILYIYYLIQND